MPSSCGMLMTCCTDVGRLFAMVQHCQRRLATDRLYVHIDWPSDGTRAAHLLNLAANLYTGCFALNPLLDVRLCLTGKQQQVQLQPRSLSRQVDYVLHDRAIEARLQTLLRNYSLAGQESLRLLDWSGINDDCSTTTTPAALRRCGAPIEPMRYQHVVLGGTFDRLHAGHKILLSKSTWLASLSVTIGLTIDSVLQRKELGSLIEPYHVRDESLRAFLTDIDPSLQYHIEPLKDQFGPSTEVRQLEAIVVSAETIDGGAAVNEERKRKGLSQLSVEVVDLLEAGAERISSTLMRHDSLGRLRLERHRVDTLSTDHFIIGLTGGICSGKSRMASVLARLGATVIDCDKLGHMAYKKESRIFGQVIAAFGADIVGDDGEINRRALGKKVFAEGGGIQQLNNIVWPEIRRLATERILEAPSRVVVLDAAVLIEAGWNSLCHEIWVPFVPRDEQIRRAVDRDSLTETDAARRIDSQMLLTDRLARAHRIFSTLGTTEKTDEQVRRAWHDVSEFLNETKRDCIGF